ncbi:hypothetical protein GCM10010166_05680 [Couchioplanes caeruleus subsp. azureus]|nr:hypothetical protein GCM10010166_05680 [Couchioplanes caeruleus subsp. azureus]
MPPTINATPTGVIHVVTRVVTNGALRTKRPRLDAARARRFGALDTISPARAQTAHEQVSAATATAENARPAATTVRARASGGTGQ